MTVKNTILIGIADLKGKVDTTLPLEDQFKAAFDQVQNHWLLTNEDDRFQAAVGAVLTANEGKSDYPQIEERVRLEMQARKAIFAGRIEEFTVLTEQSKERGTYGVIGLWQEATKTEGRN